MKPVEPEVLGLSLEVHAQVQAWFDELEGPCSDAREQLLASQLSHSLAGIVGVDPEIFDAAFLAAHRKAKRAQD